MRITSLLSIGALILILGSLSACSPFFVMRAAYEQSKILLNREDIKDRIEDPETPEEEKVKLALVLEARQFGIDLGLTPKNAFTKYSPIKGEAAAWVISAASKDEFRLHTWWFPFVGSIPYKGFFEKVDALAEARELQREGYETWVRGTEAFSTLGWFDDPVLTTTLRNAPEHIVNTVLHESLHTTVWIQDHVGFNECLANFVGFEAGREFYERRVAACSAQPTSEEQQACRVREQASLDKATRAMERELAISEGIQATYQVLKELYESPATKEEKLAQRELLFRKHIAPLRERYPELQILKTVNNAEIMQLQLYLARLKLFQDHFALVDRSWSRFIDDIKKVRDQYDSSSGADPFQILEQMQSVPETSPAHESPAV